MKWLKAREVLFLVIPLSIVLMELFLFRWPALNADTYDYYGYPFAYRSGSVATSFGYVFFIKGLILNFLLYASFLYLFLSFFWYNLKYKWIKGFFYFIVWTLFLFVIYWFLLWFEQYSFQWEITTPPEYNGNVMFLAY